MLSVEDWAEIRRLYRSERMPLKVITRVVVLEEHGAPSNPKRWTAVL